jgi:hypothetical protein
MTINPERQRDYARKALAGIRLVNGGLGLLAPAVLARQVAADAKTNPAALYAFRMFGVRTILIAVDLLMPDGPVRAHAVRTAPVIHATDAFSVALAGIRGELPPRVAVKLGLISGVNTALAIIAQPARSTPSGELRA